MIKNDLFKKNRSYAKILLLIAGALFIGLPTTGSYYLNRETSIKNKLTSTILDIELDPDDHFDPDEEISPGETQTRDFTVENLGDNGFPYKIRVENISGDDDLCDALKINVIFHDNGDDSSGMVSLDNLDYDVSTIEDDESFTMEITLPEDAEVGDASCSFDLAADIWTNNFSPGQAYFDTENFSNQINSASSEEEVQNSVPSNELLELQDVNQSTESQ